MPNIKSDIGSSSGLSTTTASGRIAKTLDLENAGNIISKLPTHVVLNVPVEVC